MSSDAIADTSVGGLDSWLQTVQDNMRVKLFAVAVGGEGDQRIVWRRDTGVMVKTSVVGVEAVRLFRKGYRIGEAKEILGRKYGYPPEKIDLLPLIRSLARNNMVQRIGGIRLSDKEGSRWLRGWKIAVSLAASRVISFVVRFGPLALISRVVYIRLQPRNAEMTKLVEANLAPALTTLICQDLSELSGGVCEITRRGYVDRYLIAMLPPMKFDRWLRKYTDIIGLEHVERALRSGKRVVLCGFHTGSYSLLPFVVAAMGYPVTVLMNAPDGEIATVENRFKQLLGAGLPYRITLAFGQLGIRKLLKSVQNGQLGMILPDAIPTAGGATCAVDLFGRTVQASTGIAWLCQKADVTIIPVFLISKSNGRHQLNVEPEICHSYNDQSDSTEILKKVYARLEKIIRTHPSQWQRWRDFHLMVCN